MSLPLIPLGLMGRSRRTKDFPTVRSSSADFDSSYDKNWTVPLPSGIQAGDLVLVMYYARSTEGTPTGISIPSGWESLFLAGTTARWIYRVADAPMSTIPVSITGSVNAGLAVNAYCFSKYSKVPVIGTEQYPQGASPNPLPLTVPDDWGSNPHVTWITTVRNAGNTSVSANPSGYGSLLSCVISNFLRFWSARRNVRATSEDPGAWSMSGTNIGIQVFGNLTIAVRGPE